MRLALGLLGVSLMTAAAGERALSRILFGSCIRQDRPIPILKTILADEPEMFIFLGDNIYGDTADMSVMRAKYDRLGAIPELRSLRKNAHIIATWDDHDYGQNDGGADFGPRKESQQEFTRFWGERSRRGEGVYDSHILGPRGRRVQIILLDTRYFRGPLKMGERRVGGPYYPTENKNVTMLGEAQWKWLAEELRKPADLRIVASSIQCIPEASGQETWSNLPHERQRFFDLVRTTKANGVLVISGDRHWSEFSVLRDRVGYPVYEFTSSSLNQLHKRGTPTANRYRAIPTSFHLENYGRLSIVWDADDPVIQSEIVDQEGVVRISKTILLSELQP